MTRLPQFFSDVMILCLFFILLSFLICSSQPVTANNSTQLMVQNGTLENDISTLEEALHSLNELTTAQKRVLEQQKAHENDMLVRYEEEKARQSERIKILEKEQEMMKEVRGRISRKLKALTKMAAKNGQSYNGQGSMLNSVPPKDCAAIYLDGEDSSGVYRVWPTWSKDGQGLLVYCDMDTDGGGWTVIHRWLDAGIPVDYFQRTWKEYKFGFGDLESSFWIGNEHIHLLTSQDGYELRFDMQRDDVKTASVYKSFRIENEDKQYKVRVSGFEPIGTGGDIFSSHDQASFSTQDRKNLPGFGTGIYEEEEEEEEDEDFPPNCASAIEDQELGWWFQKDCHLDTSLQKHPLLDKPLQDASFTEMKVRPTLFQKIKERM